MPVKYWTISFLLTGGFMSVGFCKTAEKTIDEDFDKILETSLREDYLAADTFAMLTWQDGENLQNLSAGNWVEYSNVNTDFYEDLNEHLFSIICYRFMVKINPKLSPSSLISECSIHSPRIPKLATRCFLILVRVNVDIIRNNHCASLSRCRRYFHLLRQSVETFFNRLVFWTPRDYMEFRVEILSVIFNFFGSAISPEQYQSLDTFLRSLSKFYYTYCTDHIKSILLPFN